MYHIIFGLLTAWGISAASGICFGEVTIVAFGDSITAPRGKLVVYPDILRKELPSKGIFVKVINAGVGGNTTKNGRDRLSEDVLQHDPDIAIILFGSNDARVEVFRNPPATEPMVTLAQYRANLTHFIQSLRRKATKVIMMTSPPLRWSPKLKKLYGKPPYNPDDPDGLDILAVNYAETAREISRQQQVTLVDIRAAFEAFGRQDGCTIDDLLLDGIHPNTQGQRMIADLLIPSILAMTTAKPVPDKSSQPSTLPSLSFRIERQTILNPNHRKWFWFSPRVATIPRAGKNEGPVAIMTLQKHLQSSDHFSALHIMRSDDLSASWTNPQAPESLAWRKESDQVTIGVKDITPGWHSSTGKLLAIGVKVRYNQDGHHLYDKPGSHEAAYSIYDPQKNTWSPWQMLRMPNSDSQFYLVAPGHTQWLSKADGTLLIPTHFWNAKNKGHYKTTVLHCAFDGTTLKYLQHGDELSINQGRGLYESSLTRFHGRYYLTLRSDDSAHVSVSEDGLHYPTVSPWTFDDGLELGSHNTQQHWLTHSAGLLLVYTRRGANNDHIPRHRAPLFIAQIDTDSLSVIRASERVLIPERGAAMGNFGTAAINRHESWVTVAESMGGHARGLGAKGSLFLTRVIWSKPNTHFRIP